MVFINVSVLVYYEAVLTGAQSISSTQATTLAVTRMESPLSISWNMKTRKSKLLMRRLRGSRHGLRGARTRKRELRHPSLLTRRAVLRASRIALPSCTRCTTTSLILAKFHPDREMRHWSVSDISNESQMIKEFQENRVHLCGQQEARKCLSSPQIIKEA